MMTLNELGDNPIETLSSVDFKKLFFHEAIRKDGKIGFYVRLMDAPLELIYYKTIDDTGKDHLEINVGKDGHIRGWGILRYSDVKDFTPFSNYKEVDIPDEKFDLILYV